MTRYLLGLALLCVVALACGWVELLVRVGA